MSIKNKQTFYSVVDRLDKYDLAPAMNKGICLAECPTCHRKTNRCLSAVPLANNEVSVFCSAGCDEEGILEAIGLEMKDLFPSKTKLKAMPEDDVFPTLSQAVKWAEKNLSRSPAPKFHEIVRHVYWFDIPQMKLAVVIFEAAGGAVKIYRCLRLTSAGWHVDENRENSTQKVLRRWVESH